MSSNVVLDITLFKPENEKERRALTLAQHFVRQTSDTIAEIQSLIGDGVVVSISLDESNGFNVLEGAEPQTLNISATGLEIS